MTCSVCKKRIKGQVHRWNNRPMDAKCYSYFTGHVRVLRRPRAQRRVQPATLRSILRSLFR